MDSRLFLTFVAASSLSVISAQGTVSLSIAPRPTSGASRIVNPSFAGFGIESSNLYSFTGGSRENELTANLLKNLADYAGAPPNLRIGGNTQDYFVYDHNMNDYAVENNPDSIGQGAFASDSLTIGPRYFEVINRFPANTPITFGLNLAYDEPDYIDRIAAMATQALNRLTDVDLVSFEIGNEPDLYLQNGFRTGSWGGQVYTEEWLERAGAVYEQVLRPNGIGSNLFEPGCTASTIGTSFQINDLDQLGIGRNANGSTAPYIASWNQHDYYYYIGVSTYAITQDHFLTLSTTNDQFADWELQIQQAADTGYPYALREMGVVGPIGLYGITDVFGAALWSLNFFFYAATLNITSVGMHMTDNSNASAWQPIQLYGNQPYVRPNYYAFAAFDQTIGPTCLAQVGGYIIEDQPEDYVGRTAAYTVYQNGLLASLVLINSKPANVSQTSKKSLTFALNLDPEFAGQDVYLAYLTSDGADAREGTTFNGVSFEQAGDGTPTTVDSSLQTVTVGNDGSVSIDVRDSQAVIANLGSPVGQRKPNASACSVLASASPNARAGGTSTGPNPATSNSDAATSSTVGSSPGASATNGVPGKSTRILGTLTSAFLGGFVLMCF